MSNAGKMGAGAAWLFAIGGAVVGVVLGHFIPGFIGFIVGLLLYVGGGWATVHMTQATAGRGILAWLVGGLVAAVVAFIMWKMAVSAASSQVGAAWNDAVKQAGTQGGGMNAADQAKLAQVGEAAAGAFGTIAGLLA